jgi:molecular chaperone GrpE
MERREEKLPSEEEPVTARDETAEPSGEEDPANEAERDEARDEASSGQGPGDAARYLELAQRTQADLENYKKRVTKELAVAGERAKGGLVRELLPVVDNLERALQSAGDGEQHLAEGVRLVHSELVAVLERNGVQAFDPAGEAFDPAVHEALSTRPEEGADAGVILDVVEKGYKLNGTVLRPARVVVSG